MKSLWMNYQRGDTVSVLVQGGSNSFVPAGRGLCLG